MRSLLGNKTGFGYGMWIGSTTGSLTGSRLGDLKGGESNHLTGLGLRKPTGFLYNQVYNKDTTVHDCCLPQTNQHTPLPNRQSVRRVVSHTSPPAPASHPPTHKVHWLRPCSPQAIGRRSAQLPLQSAALKYGGRRSAVGPALPPALPLAKQSLAEAKPS